MEKYSKGSRLASAVAWQTVALGAGVGIATTVVLMLAFAAVLASVDVPSGAPSIISSICLGLGALLGGFIAAKRNGRNGMIVGFLTGVAVFFVFAIIALMLGSALGIPFLIRLLVAASFAAVGGILGINLRRHRRYI